MRLLIDMNLAPRWVAWLVEAGHDGAHWSALGDSRATDVEIIEFARQNGYTILTQDLDFGAILAASRGNKPSVVLIRSDDTSPEVVGATVAAALRDLREAVEAGALISVDAARARVRLLPLTNGSPNT